MSSYYNKMHEKPVFRFDVELDSFFPGNVREAVGEHPYTPEDAFLRILNTFDQKKLRSVNFFKPLGPVFTVQKDALQTVIAVPEYGQPADVATVTEYCISMETRRFCAIFARLEPFDVMTCTNGFQTIIRLPANTYLFVVTHTDVHALLTRLPHIFPDCGEEAVNCITDPVR